MATAEAPSFSPELFAFLRELKAAQRARVVQREQGALRAATLKEPALAFVEDMAYRLPRGRAAADRGQALAVPDLPRHALREGQDAVQDARRHLLPPRRAPPTPTPPGMYLHLEPRHVFLGAGIWHPGTPALKRIRDALVARPEGWRRGGRGGRAGLDARRRREAQAPAGGLRQGAPADRGHQAQELRDHLAAHAARRDRRAASWTSARRAPPRRGRSWRSSARRWASSTDADHPGARRGQARPRRSGAPRPRAGRAGGASGAGTGRARARRARSGARAPRGPRRAGGCGRACRPGCSRRRGRSSWPAARRWCSHQVVTRSS